MEAMSLFNFRHRDVERGDVAAQPVAATWWSWRPYRRTVGPGGAVADAQQAAYVDGAHDARRDETDVARRAYREGERDGRRLESERHRGHPVLTVIVAILALVAIGYGFLSFQQGSFAGGGAVIDQKIAQLRGDAGQAGVASGQAVQNAGATITARSQAF